MPMDEGVIRYLMKEMDPSEEIEFERCMMEDENLLIEVESLRKTLEKTNALPQLSPPKNLTQSITDQARNYRLKQLQSSKFNNIPYVQYAAAAVIIVAMGIGYTMFDLSNDSTSADESVRADQGLMLSTPMSDADARDPAFNNVSSGPWVDRNNVIRFTDGFNSNLTQSEAREAELQESMLKLVKVEDTNQLLFTRPSEIQYTGSPD